jgi:hypothetical protein
MCNARSGLRSGRSTDRSRKLCDRMPVARAVIIVTTWLGVAARFSSCLELGLIVQGEA